MEATRIDDRSFRLFFTFLKAQVFLLVSESLSVDDPAPEPARPAVLVVRPGAHTAFPRFVDGGFHVGEPFFTHIFCLQAASGVHEKTADACLVHFPDLSSRFRFVKLFVP